MVVELERFLSGRTRLVVLASDPTQLERLAHLLALSGPSRGRARRSFPRPSPEVPHRVQLVRGHLEEGFSCCRAAGGRHGRRDLRRAAAASVGAVRCRRAASSRALAELQPGDYMVHVDHGIGIYRGLQHIVGRRHGGRLHSPRVRRRRPLLSCRSTASTSSRSTPGPAAAAPHLARLGGSAWTRTKKTRARRRSCALARELLELEAFRAVHTREAFARPGRRIRRVRGALPVRGNRRPEDRDRRRRRDLAGDKPMDRVVCGDVGYGKTEVALRAAYLAAMGGRQVAVLGADDGARAPALRHRARALRGLSAAVRDAVAVPLSRGERAGRRRA